MQSSSTCAAAHGLNSARSETNVGGNTVQRRCRRDASGSRVVGIWAGTSSRVCAVTRRAASAAAPRCARGGGPWRDAGSPARKYEQVFHPVSLTRRNQHETQQIRWWNCRPPMKAPARRNRRGPLLRHPPPMCEAQIAPLHRRLLLHAAECVSAEAQEAASGATAGATKTAQLLLMVVSVCFEINETLL